jgi:DNA polymerase
MTLTEILKSVQYPENTLVLDFETYYDDEYSLKEMSIVEYVADARFEFTGLGIKINDTTSVFIPGPKVPWAISRLKKKFGKALHNVTVVAKNTKFDVLILAEKFGIYPPYVIDIEDLSRYYDSRMSQRLKDLAKLFKLPAKGDTSQFKGQHCVDIDWSAMKKYCLRDVEDEYALLTILLPVVDNPEVELPLAMHTLNLYLRPPFDLDYDLAQKISDEMDTTLDQDLGKVGWVLEYATKKKKTIPDIIRARSIFPKILAAALPEGEKVPMKQGKKEMIPALAQEDVAFQLLLVHPDERVRNLCKAKAACSSWPLHQAKVKSIIKQAECSGNKCRVAIKYYGAHTGRPSGTQGTNLLNLGGKGRGKPIHPLIGKVRSTLLAPPGHKLVIADSRQIEARELAWIAGQDDLVEDFRTGGDPYSRLAEELFQERVWNPTEEEKLTPEGKIADIRRGFGKDAILGCGYGLGTNTFFNRCRQNETLRPLFDSGEYTWDTIDRLIKLYRSTYAQIPKFWKVIEKCFRWVTKYSHEVMTYYIPSNNHCLHTGMENQKPIIKNAILTFWGEGHDTIIQLPSGRRLFYRYASVSKDGKIKDIHGPLWGGTLTENVIQAICRDLIVGWLFECEKNDIPIILYPYDELVGCVPEDHADEALKKMMEIMRHGPDWSKGLPLDVEGEISKCYKK